MCGWLGSTGAREIHTHVGSESIPMSMRRITQKQKKKGKKNLKLVHATIILITLISEKQEE